MPDTAAAIESAEIDSALYRAWLDAKVTAALWADRLKDIEATIRVQTDGAKVVTAEGKPRLRRIVREAKNVTWTSDYYRRLGDRGGDDE